MGRSNYEPLLNIYYYVIRSPGLVFRDANKASPKKKIRVKSLGGRGEPQTKLTMGPNVVTLLHTLPYKVLANKPFNQPDTQTCTRAATHFSFPPLTQETENFCSGAVDRRPFKKGLA